MKAKKIVAVAALFLALCGCGTTAAAGSSPSGRGRRSKMGLRSWLIDLSRGDSRPALALDVDQDCRLLVQYEDGSREILSSGEISIRFAESLSEESAL